METCLNHSLNRLQVIDMAVISVKIIMVPKGLYTSALVLYTRINHLHNTRRRGIVLHHFPNLLLQELHTDECQFHVN